jgi:antitoxin ParD1/3/4
MANISASIPDQLKSWIETQIHAGHYSSTSDYLRDLIRHDQHKKLQLENLLLEGLYSEERILADEAYWESKKQSLCKN